MTQTTVQEAELVLARAKDAEARERKATEERANHARLRTRAASNEVRSYREEVDQAARVAAALKPGPPAPLHIRDGARNLLHGRGNMPAWGTGNTDAMLEALFLLRDRGVALYNLPGLDDAGRAELDSAESAAWRAVMARARVVAGEA